MHTISEKKLLMLRPSEILPAALMSRQRFDADGLRSLADSIAVHGIIHPLSVRRTQTGKYELISGERRRQAALLAGIRRIPCILHRLDDQTAAFYPILENLQRADVSMFEAAEYINRLITDFRISQSEAAVRLGMSSSELAARLRLLRISAELREKIITANLSQEHALLLLRLPDKLRPGALAAVIGENLSQDDTRRLISEMLNPEPEADDKPTAQTEPPQSDSPVRKSAIGDMRLFYNSLTKLTDTLRSAGIDSEISRNETGRYIEYKVRVSKADLDARRCKQLKIC